MDDERFAGVIDVDEVSGVVDEELSAGVDEDLGRARRVDDAVPSEHRHVELYLDVDVHVDARFAEVVRVHGEALAAGSYVEVAAGSDAHGLASITDDDRAWVDENVSPVGGGRRVPSTDIDNRDVNVDGEVEASGAGDSLVGDDGLGLTVKSDDEERAVFRDADRPARRVENEAKVHVDKTRRPVIALRCAPTVDLLNFSAEQLNVGSG